MTNPRQWPAIFVAKMGLVALLFSLTLIHDLVVGPRVRADSRKGRGGQNMEGSRLYHDIRHSCLDSRCSWLSCCYCSRWSSPAPSRMVKNAAEFALGPVKPISFRGPRPMLHRKTKRQLMLFLSFPAPHAPVFRGANGLQQSRGGSLPVSLMRTLSESVKRVSGELVSHVIVSLQEPRGAREGLDEAFGLCLAREGHFHDHTT